MVLDSPEVDQNSTLIAKLLGDAKLPAIFTHPHPVEAGGLMAYSFDLIELYKRVANNINAILRGANPGDIPIYQVTKFELSINLKTAKQLLSNWSPGRQLASIKTFSLVTLSF